LPAVFFLHFSGRAIDVPGDAIQRYEVKASSNDDYYEVFHQCLS
jgi:hypothetical protein